MEKQKKIAVVILTYNSPKVILGCLKSLYISENKVTFQTIIVDNGSDEQLAIKIQSEYPKVIVIENKINYGFSKGINYGIKLAYEHGYEYILLLNDDTLIPPNLISRLVEVAAKHNLPISGPKILTLDGKIWSKGGLLDPKRFSGGLIDYGKMNDNDDKIKKVDYVSGTAMLVNKEVFDRIGFLDEIYFLYYDDVDFCYRAKEAGFSSYIVPQAEVTHLETVTIKKNSPTHYYHSCKSHLIFVFRRAPYLMKIRELLRMVKTILELFTQKDLIKRKYELLAIRDFILLRSGQKTNIKPK